MATEVISLEAVPKAPQMVSVLNPDLHPIEIGDAVSSSLEACLLPEKIQQLHAFANGATPWLHLRNIHSPSNIIGATPTSMTGDRDDQRWWSSARVVLGLLRLMELHPISFSCENSGKLFVNLVRQPGAGRAAAYSADAMDGHTDALAFPLPDSFRSGTTPPPGPDFVILIGLRNRDQTPTFASSLSAILDGTSSQDTFHLSQSKFILGQQPSFDCRYVGIGQPVLGLHPAFGRVIRYSQSRVTVDEEDAAANLALLRLGKRMVEVRSKICVAPGDVLLINNRLALHGRDAVHVAEDGEGRWLLRVYAYHRKTIERLPSATGFTLEC